MRTIAAAFIALFFCLSTVYAAADRILISNFQNPGITAVVIGEGQSYGYGFQIGVNDFDLHAVEFEVGGGNQPNVIVELFDNAPGNNPGSPILQFVGKRSLTNLTVRTSWTVPASPFPSYRLEAGKAYWVVITNYDIIVNHRGNVTIPPAGAGATLIGARTGPRPPKTTTTTYVHFEAMGTPAPSHGAAFVNPATGRVAFAAMRSGVFTNWLEFPQIVGSQWEVLGFGQFIGTAPMDAFIRNKLTGAVAVWQTNGENFTNFHQFPQAPNAAWQFKGIADFNNDGIADLLYQNPMSGTVVVGITVGNRVTQWRSFPKKPNPLWQIVGCMDNNNDGIADVYFKNSSTGQIAYWRTNGFDFTTWQVFPQVPSSTWQIPGAWKLNAEFNLPSVWFWNPSTRTVAYWRSNATQFTAWNPVQEQIPPGFVPMGFGPIR